MNKQKSKKPISLTQYLIVKDHSNLSKTMYYALLGIITEVLSDREIERKEKLKLNPKAEIKIDNLNEAKIAKDIYDKIGKIYPDSTFNVVIFNLTNSSGEHQFACSQNNSGYLSVQLGNKIFMIFKYKD